MTFILSPTIEAKLTDDLQKTLQDLDMNNTNLPFTLEKLTKIIKSNKQPEAWFTALANNLPTFEITTAERASAFISQCAHESADFTQLHENLNYKASSLVSTWPKRFTDATAIAYAKQPEKIANKVYADRMGNGNEASGEGWKFRGRGPIQITGKANYTECSMALYNDLRLLDNPDLLETDPDIAIKSACWYWNSRKLNELADKSDTKGITKKINGGDIGLVDRIHRYEAALKIMKG